MSPFGAVVCLRIAIIDAMPPNKKPVRVLRVIARMNVGGPAQHVALLTRRLDRDHYRTMLVSGRVGPGEEAYSDLDGIAIHYIDQLGPEIRPFKDLAALLALVRLLRTYRPHIVETHTAKAGMLGRIAVLFSSTSRPVIIHVYHGHVLRGYFGPFRTGAYRLIEGWLGRISDALITVSPATADELVKMGIAPRSKFAVVPLGLELDRFLELGLGPDGSFREELEASADDVLFTFIGRLVPIKRPDVMLRAVSIARRAGCPVKVAVVGDGLLRPDLEGLSRELGCQGAVCFLGYRRDLARIAAGSDAALLTSDNEGTPVALIEASAAGRPSVSTRVGGVPDIVVDGAGLLAPAGDERAIAGQIVQLSRDAALRRQMGTRARQHVRHHFAAPRLLHDMDALYSRLLNSVAGAE